MIEFPRWPRRHRPKWIIHDSDFSNYMNDFESIDRDNKLPELLKRLGRRRAVVIDLMASTAGISSMYSNGLRGQFLAVGSEKDERGTSVKSEDNNKGISYISGDIRRSKTWDEIAEWVGDQKVDLIMERAYGGLNWTPTNVNFYRAVLNRMWKMLSPENGLLVLQTPPERILNIRGIPIRSWLDMLGKAGIYGRFGDLKKSQDGIHQYGVLMIEKNPSAITLPDILSH